jgi:hypothetical protein
MTDFKLIFTDLLYFLNIVKTICKLHRITKTLSIKFLK